MKKHFLKGNLIKVILHILAWTIFIGLPFYFIKRWEVGKDFIWLYYINAAIWGIIFYFNYLYLVPRYFFGKRKYKYYLSVLGLILCFYFVSDISNKLVFKYRPDDTREGQIINTPENKVSKPGPGMRMLIVRPGPSPFRNMHRFNYLSTSFVLIFLSLGLKVLERQSKIEELQKETEKEMLNSELAFLKNQISPHFFFNTLNNIYALIGINVDDSQKAVLRLSKLMRYLLYESEKGNTLLSQEIEFMNNYIDLMKLRMSDKVSLAVSFPEKYNDRDIAPLLFVPFIENAFKHGISYREKSFINISMEFPGDSVVFKCENSFHRGKEKEKESGNKGIGLENVKKRLNLLFPGNYDLNINTTDNQFNVSLEIRMLQ